jgi:hypothetical protein
MPGTTYYVDNTVNALKVGGAGTDSNPYRSLRDLKKNKGSLPGNAKIRLNGLFRESFSYNELVDKTDISFDSATKQIRSNNAIFANFAVGNIIEVSNSLLNDQQYTIAAVDNVSVPRYIQVAASNTLRDEAAAAGPAGGIKISHINADNYRAALDILKSGTSASDRIEWDLGFGFDRPRAEISSLGIVDSRYAWVASPANTGSHQEWYLEMADGSNPSFAEISVCIVNGNYMTGSASNNLAEIGHRRGFTANGDGVGSLSPGQFAWGDPAGNGWSTLVVRWDAGNPLTLGIPVEFGRVDCCISIPFNNHRFYGGIFSGANLPGTLSGPDNQTGACVRYRGTDWDFILPVFKYAGETAIITEAANTLNVIGAESYWSGHRFIAKQSNATINAYHCVGYGEHLFGLIGAAATAGVFKVRNCIAANQEAAAFDYHSATNGLLDEDYNYLYPRATAAAGGLGYTNAGHNLAGGWPTTGAHSFPAGANTITTNSRAAIDALAVTAGYVNGNPNFVAASDLGYALCNFLPTSGLALGKGVSGLFTNLALAANGELFDRNVPDIGSQQTPGAFSPSVQKRAPGGGY